MTQMRGNYRTGRTGANGREIYREHNTYEYDTYVDGNTVRKLDVQRQLEEPGRRLSHETRKNREKARHMSLGYVAFLTAAFCACAFLLINYIQLQAELTNRTKGIATLESRLNTMKLTNDETYSRITSSVDLEEIKRVAIAELGMTYAEEGQIITYDSVTHDYMRQTGGDSN